MAATLDDVVLQQQLLNLSMDNLVDSFVFATGNWETTFGYYGSTQAGYLSIITDNIIQLVSDLEQLKTSIDFDAFSLELAVGDGMAAVRQQIAGSLGTMPGDAPVFRKDFHDLAADLRSLLQPLLKLIGASPATVNAIGGRLANWAQDFKENFLTEALGGKGLTPKTNRWSVGGSIVDSQMQASLHVFERQENSIPFIDDAINKLSIAANKLIGHDVFQWYEGTGGRPSTMPTIKEQVLRAFGFDANAQGGLLGTVLGKPAVADPDQAVAQGVGQLISASLAGMGAHLVNIVLGTTVAGTKLGDGTGLAAMIAQFAGFGEIVKALRGPYIDATVGTPYGYKVNADARPVRPGAGVVLDWWTRRHLTDAGLKDKLLSYGGMPDELLAIAQDAAWRTASFRELQILSETGNLNDDELKDAVQELGFRDSRVDHVVTGLRHRWIDSWRRSVANAAIDGYVKGYDSADQLGDTLRDLEYNDNAVAWMQRVADARARVDVTTQELAAIDAAYNVGNIDDATFRARLSTIFTDPADVSLHFTRERLARFHKVYLTTAAEDAATAVPLWQRAFIDGEISGPQFLAQLAAADMDPAVIDLTYAVADDQRKGKTLAEFRTFELPALRDKVIHGELTTAGYFARLVAANMPAEYAATETDYASTLAARYRTGVVRTEQLPSVRSAYVMGLITKPALVSVMGQAGLSDATINAQVILLDGQRGERLAAAAKAVASAQQQAANRERLATAAEQSALLARERQAQADRDATARNNARTLAAQAKVDKATVGLIGNSLINEVRKGVAANAEKVLDLAGQLVGWLDRVTLAGGPAAVEAALATAQAAAVGPNPTP